MKPMHRLGTSLFVLACIGVTSAAYADLPPAECDSKQAGDACETLDGKPGTCEDVDGSLDCVESTTASSSSSGGGSGGGDGNGGAAPASGGDKNDEGGGCSVAQAGAPLAAGSVNLLSMVGLAAARLVGRRRSTKAR